MSFFEGDVTAWLDTVGPLVDEAGDDGPVATAASMFGPVRKWGLHQDAIDHSRDELVALIHTRTDCNRPDSEPFGEDYEIADVILAAGWRAP